MPTFETWGAWFSAFFVMPVSTYLLWAVAYGISQFVVTDKVVKYEVESVYGIFTQNKAIVKTVKPLLKFLPMPIVFHLGHFLFFFVMHCVSVICWHSYWFNIAIVVVVMQWAMFNGANYYMDYFAKKYEK